MQQCTQDIKDSKLSLSNPCQYCGQTFQRKDAHLRACVGVFNGVYLHRRLARGKPLALTGTGPEALIGHVRHENDETRAGAPVRADDGDTGAPPSPKPRQPTEGTFHSDMGYGNGPGRSLRGQGTAGYATSEVVKAGPKRRSARQRPKPAAAPAITLKRLWEKQRPAAGDYEPPLTALAREHPRPLPGHDGNFIVALQGDGTGVDFQRWQTGTRAQVGSSADEAHPGRDSGEPRPSDGGGTEDVAPPEPSGQIGGVGCRQLFPPTRSSADEPIGQEVGILDSVSRVKLGNRHNHCYANALVMSLIHLDCALGPLGHLAFFKGDLLRVVNWLLRSDGARRLYLWDDSR